jgi:hypothetical protein
MRGGGPVDLARLRGGRLLGDFGGRKRLPSDHQALCVDDHDLTSGENRVRGRRAEGVDRDDGPVLDGSLRESRRDADAGQQDGETHGFG